MEKKKLGFALTGSFCTWAKVVPILEQLTEKYEVFPILSPIGYVSDNRFGKAADWIARIETACKRKVWHTIEQVEPIGPRNLLDLMAVVPCTGNTLGKLANGITDTGVTMACKASLRNGNPLVLAISTNDALGASARNIGVLMNAKNVYLVPMSQDDPQGKPASLVAHFQLLDDTLEAAQQGKQLQPVFQ
ncbi:MAG: dipicolinate synthase subunit B [Anaerotruncus sp.]|nr:dipicolinate synthase subunit B [Anaerotruncus sp.]